MNTLTRRRRRMGGWSSLPDYEYVAKFAKTGTIPGNNGDPTTTWVANVGSNDITLQNTGGNFAWNDSGSGWDGDGSAGDPYCLCADGTGDYGTFASAPVASDADFTVELWTYVASGPPAVNTTLFGNYVSNTGLRYYVASSNGCGTWQIGNGSSSSFIDDGAGKDGYGAAWQHHVLTYNAATDYATLYRNGSRSHVPVSSAFSPNTAGVRRLFQSDAGMNAMKLATLRVYNKCLSADDVLANYNAGVTAASTDSG